jgi:hypothetical protein
LDGIGPAFIGADATALAKIVVDFIAVIIDVDGVIRANIPADTAVIAQFLIDFRSLVSPGAGFVVQRGSALNNGTFCQFHEVSFKNVLKWFQNLRLGSRARRQADRESAAYVGM